MKRHVGFPCGPLLTLLLLLMSTGGCGGSPDAEGDGRRGDAGGSSGGPSAAGRQRPGRGGPPGAQGERPMAAVPVEVVTAQRDRIAAYIETNGTLEAETEVDVVARTAGPVVELLVEEGDAVTRGQLLARIEQDEIRAQLEISRVALDETRQAYERAVTLQRDELISTETFEQTSAAYESAKAQYLGAEIQLAYTEVRAPFAGTIVRRYVDRAQNVANNTPLVRLSDFTPLLCPIQVPERELSRLRVRQPAQLTVEAFAGERFDARVLRISPVVDSASGTIRVTLEVDGRDRLRPGMFARVFLETDVREQTVVVPRVALSLESIGEAVYVVEDGAAVRRSIELGFETGDTVEVMGGVEAGDEIVVVGQDGLSDGTPVRVLRRNGTVVAAVDVSEPAGTARGERPRGGGG